MTHHPVSAATQLEVAAHWLREAAIATRDRDLRENPQRVANECDAVVRKAN